MERRRERKQETGGEREREPKRGENSHGDGQRETEKLKTASREKKNIRAHGRTCVVCALVCIRDLIHLF